MDVNFSFSPITDADARAILTWRYDGPYGAYNTADSVEADALSELLDPRSPYFAVRDVGHEAEPPLAFFALGSSCEVGREIGAPYALRPDGSATVGLGLRPDLTGRGLGLSLMQAGLDYARGRYAPTGFRLYVYAWNARAIRVYERAGFVAVGETRVPANDGERVFIEMTRSR